MPGKRKTVPKDQAAGDQPEAEVKDDKSEADAADEQPGAEVKDDKPVAGGEGQKPEVGSRAAPTSYVLCSADGEVVDTFDFMTEAEPSPLIFHEGVLYLRADPVDSSFAYRPVPLAGEI